MNTAFSSVRTLLARTGSFDLDYQSNKYAASKTYIAKVLATLIVLFSLVGLVDLLIMEDPLPLIELRMLFSPTFILLFALLYVSNSFLLFYCSAMLALGGSAVCYGLYTLDGSTLMAMNSTAVFTLNLLAMMPALRPPLWISIIPSILMVVALAFLTKGLPYLDWFFFGGTLIALLIVICFSEIAREIDEYALYSEEIEIKRDQQKKLQWSFMTGRLLRHELSNQLIGLSSSLDMMQRDDRISNKNLLSDIENKTNSLRHNLNELALASEWSAKDESNSDESNLCQLLVSAFSGNEIPLTTETETFECTVICKSKNICLYALNRLARAIHDEFKELGLWGEVRLPDDTHTILEVVIKSLPTENETAVQLFSSTGLSDSSSGIAAARELLKTEGVSTNLNIKENRIIITFDHFQETLDLEKEKTADFN